LRVAHLPGIDVTRQYGETSDDCLEIINLPGAFEESRKSP